MDNDNKRIFGYGSLIFKVDLSYLERQRATIRYWMIRFGQFSYHHRGTENASSRVVTLMSQQGALCKSTACFIESRAIEHCEYWKNNDYCRAIPEMTLECLIYIEGTVNIFIKQNPAFIGPETDPDTDHHIAPPTGPIGTIRDHVTHLDRRL